MSRPYQVLTGDQIEHFLTRGYVVLRECFSREAARSFTDTTFVRLGYDPDDPSTWREAVIEDGRQMEPVAPRPDQATVCY